MMATDNAADRSYISELFAGDIYKRNQGRLIRQLTFIGFCGTLALGLWRFHEVVMKSFTLPNVSETTAGFVRAGVPFLLLAIGSWAIYRLVNWPVFADFLISVQAEMNKVTWPSRPELVKASLVVIFTVLFMAAILFAFDLLWRSIFQFLEIS